MKKYSPVLLFSVLVIASYCFASPDPIPTWTDPEAAAAEHPDFLLQGEYTGERDGSAVGLQAAALDDGEFHVLHYAGGVPGDGWDGTEIGAQVMTREELQKAVEGLERIRRRSSTLGEKAPAGAMIVFDGKENEHIEGTVKDGLLWEGSKMITPVGDFSLHLEFRHPFKPGRAPGNQDRGNSGIYIFNNYEVQVLDSFGLDLNQENNAISPGSRNDQWCASLYKFKTPDVPMVFPPLEWQTYDIEFTAPRFRDGEKVRNARITLRHNGVLVHDDVELPQGTGAGANRAEREKGGILFQGHGNPVAFRNVWLVTK